MAEEGKTNERSPLKNDLYSTEHFNWDNWKEWDTEWFVQMKMDIREVRLMYSFTSFYLDNYTGSPGRPPDEKNYLAFVKGELYKMIQDYNLTHNSL